MSLKRRFRLLKTFQFRLALYYVALTTLALITAFSVNHVLLRRKLQIDARLQLQDKLEDLAGHYLGEPDKTAIQIQLPETIRSLFYKTYPQTRIGLVEKEEQQDGTGYEVIASTGSEYLEIIISAAGDTWVSQREPIIERFNSLVAPLKYEPSPMYALLLSPSGKSLAGEMSHGFTPERIERIFQSLSNRNKALLSGSDGVPLAAQRMFDGNILCLSNEFITEQMALRRWRRWAMGLILLFLPISMGIGWLLSHKAMAGVKRVTLAAREVDANQLHTRVESKREGAEIEELAEAFNSMVARIKSLVQELKNITANIAHDLRTPITRIRGLMETTEWNKSTDAERTETVGMVIEECDQLTPLINDILEISQAEAGMLTLQIESFDLVAEIQKTVLIFSALADEKGITLKTDLPTQPLVINADHKRIQQVIANLLDNAIKYTPNKGQVQVRLSSDGKEVCFEVGDNGIGIPEAERQRVFERFYRGHYSRTVPGNGLGLSLVKAFINAHGGSIEVKSTSPNGCVFSIHLPLIPPGFSPHG